MSHQNIAKLNEKATFEGIMTRVAQIEFSLDRVENIHDDVRRSLGVDPLQLSLCDNDAEKEADTMSSVAEFMDRLFERLHCVNDDLLSLESETQHLRDSIRGMIRPAPVAMTSAPNSMGSKGSSYK